MNEDLWNSEFDLDGLLWNLDKQLTLLLPKRPSGRKSRLFATACVRQISNGFQDNPHVVLDQIETLVDAISNRERSKIKDIRGCARGLFRLKETGDDPGMQAIFDALVRRVPSCAAYETNKCCRSFDDGIGEGSRRALLREILGNPFRKVVVDRRWFSSTVLDLACAIYRDRAFDRLPILADALQDAGCDNDDILNHLRSEGPHVRGCWAIDLILGKE